jgi:predicted amidohydrolase
MPARTVGVVQMTSRNSTDVNFEANSSRVAEAKKLECDIVCFPECFSFIGARAGEAQSIAEPLDGRLL